MYLYGPFLPKHRKPQTIVQLLNGEHFTAETRWLWGGGWVPGWGERGPGRGKWEEGASEISKGNSESNKVLQ